MTIIDSQAKRDHEFESAFLQQRVCELSVPERRTDGVRTPIGRSPGQPTTHIRPI